MRACVPQRAERNRRTTSRSFAWLSRTFLASSSRIQGTRWSPPVHGPASSVLRNAPDSFVKSLLQHTAFHQDRYSSKAHFDCLCLRHVRTAAARASGCQDSRSCHCIACTLTVSHAPSHVRMHLHDVSRSHVDTPTYLQENQLYGFV
jgi:hypothetical protein